MIFNYEQAIKYKNKGPEGPPIILVLLEFLKGRGGIFSVSIIERDFPYSIHEENLVNILTVSDCPIPGMSGKTVKMLSSFME